MSQDKTASQRWRIEPWNVTLSPTQGQHIQQLAGQLLQALAQQPKAWLVLDGWEDNPVAAWLDERYPAWTAQRQVLPDPALSGLEDMAPCLLPLHQWPVVESDASQRLDTLHDLLGRMWLDAQRRLVRQHLCGVLFSTAEVDEVFDHWLLLGRQVAPDGLGRWAFRHHDPRVLQRVWPSLSAEQRHTLLGPAHSLWQLTAPWGPWAEQDLVVHQQELVGPGPSWHVCGPTNGGKATQAPHRLLTKAQIQHTASGASGHQVWLTLALAAYATNLQPTAMQMNQLLNQALQWGFTRPQQWQEWVLVSWQGLDGASRFDNPPRIQWDAPQWAPVAMRMKELLTQQPRQGVPELLELSMPDQPAE